MAQVSTSSKAFFLSVLLIVLAAAVTTTVSAQDFAPAPAPMATGSAFFLPVSGAVVGASLLLSLLTLLKH